MSTIKDEEELYRNLKNLSIIIISMPYSIKSQMGFCREHVKNICYMSDNTKITYIEFIDSTGLNHIMFVHNKDALRN